MVHVLEHGVPLGPTIVPNADGLPPDEDQHATILSAWADKYRGSTVADLDLPPALSTSPSTSLSSAMLAASSHDYSHLTVVSDHTRSLLGYLSIARLKQLFESGQLQPTDSVEQAMVKFKRGKRTYKTISLETELFELEGFFENIGPLATGEPQEFAVVTDGGRKFVLGVVTREDLETFVKKRPA
ncbi:hypothetical protein H2202_003826 [Exophiala xenobiotica]|nr:hypothetical protein H2202_003826 [Exophiala xenobiotica]KAK5261120.1 hypothetical protein LTR40_002812 [Exophiala xenobiotica]KAK5416033.1 hypothetical protein LTR90_005253 [Exophiala xenobiotica]KAK5511574.1 hypothetical protein LTR21_005990 [Exophiala xenobiotica]